MPSDFNATSSLSNSSLFSVSPQSLSPSASSTSAGKQVHPATFVKKLYLMVDDVSTNAYIRWGSDGTTFIVFYPEEFAREILPRFFKHNNFSSFVRQLNMYGFHKVPHFTANQISSFDNPVGPSGDIFSRSLSLSSSTYLTSSSSSSSYTSSWEFSHENFRRNQMNLLLNVRRKIQQPNHNNSNSMSPSSTSNALSKPISDGAFAGPIINNPNPAVPSNFYNLFSTSDISNRLLEYLAYTAAASAATNTAAQISNATQPLSIGAAPLKDAQIKPEGAQECNFAAIFSELTTIKTQQKQILEKLSHLEIDQSLLWRDSIKCQDRCNSQQELIEKILRFLASVFTSGDKKLKEGIASLFHTLNHLQPTSISTNATASSTSTDTRREFDKKIGGPEKELNDQWLSSASTYSFPSPSPAATGMHTDRQYTKRQKLLTNGGENSSLEADVSSTKSNRDILTTTPLELIQDSKSTASRNFYSPCSSYLQSQFGANNAETDPSDLENLVDAENPLDPDFDLTSFLNSEIAYSEDSWPSTATSTSTSTSTSTPSQSKSSS